MAVCANGAVIDHPATYRASPPGRCPSTPWANRRRSRPVPSRGPGWRLSGRQSAHYAATPQFVSSPGHEHAWLDPDNTEVSMEDLLSAPAVKLLVRKAGARSADMAAELAKHVGTQGHITDSTNNGLIEWAAGHQQGHRYRRTRPAAGHHR